MAESTDKSLRIFISSTFVDLEEYREAARSAILGSRNHANDMIHWAADERAPSSLSADEVCQSDLMMLILAHRYGTIPQDETRSITEIEFDIAKEAGIPVYAFFVDEKFAWPGDKFDVKNYDKLRALKEKVAQHCTPKYFTTRESLAFLVIQAIMNYDRTHRGWLYTPRVHPLPRVFDAKEIDEYADLLVQIGVAEDGLPMALEISRSDNLALPLAEITKALGASDETVTDARLDAYIKGVIRDAESGWKSRGVGRVKLPSGETVRCYVSKKRLSDLLSGSLLASLLPSPVLGGTFVTVPLLTTSAGTAFASTGGRNRFLAVSLSNEQRFVVGRLSESEPQYSFWHPFLSESLGVFSECEYEIQHGSKILAEGKLGKYRQDLKREFESVMDESGRADVQVTFKVSRRAIAQVIRQIIERLSNEYHKRQVIHGDLKPQNCLITSDGGCLVDGLELPVGRVSDALTSSWASPEQIAMKAVAEATDIYPIGLMLVSLLSGLIAGEVVIYQVPLESGNRVLSITRNPQVFFNRQHATVPSEGEKAWKDLIEKCLRFDPGERYCSTGEFSSEFDELISRFPPIGWLPMEFKKGNLRMVRLPNGSEDLYRILHDDSYGVVALFKCPTCHSLNRSGALFCQGCGTRVFDWMR